MPVWKVMENDHLHHPVCRPGVRARELSNGMVYIRHPQFSSRIINRESWKFLQMCDGRGLEELQREIAESMGYRLTLDQLRTSVRDFAERGFFEGTSETSRSYRICDASPVISKLSKLVRWLASPWFAALTFMALLACLALLVADWGRFVAAVALAARERPVATLFLYYLTFIPIALLHELGHASVAGHHGGEVPEIVICSTGSFAVLTNQTALKERRARVWYLSMGTVVDVFIWLALLVAFHYSARYLLVMFLLPQTIYFLIYSYSIFKNSDYLKVVSALLNQPVPLKPWDHLVASWRKLPPPGAARKFLYIMTASLVVKLAVTAFLIWTFLWVEPRVLLLYLIYRAMVYVIGNWPIWLRRLRTTEARVPSLASK